MIDIKLEWARRYDPTYYLRVTLKDIDTGIEVYRSIPYRNNCALWEGPTIEKEMREAVASLRALVRWKKEGREPTSRTPTSGGSWPPRSLRPRPS